MTTLTLRSYNREIETLIEQGKTDLAIAHSLHILKFFPKHVDTYRLLGKAYLENQRLGDAADVFQRVLSAVPEDFVSHIGMSIIREDEGNLDASIWHMQRAYDVQSSNITIQDELRRLYDKRDGIEPPKIRLTRAALARMYARGDLVGEAITELRSALQEEPDRADLLVLLARMYYTNQQRVKSIQTCSQVLNKLPYCLEANLVIQQALRDTNRAEEAEVYLARAQELDPYAAYLSEHAPTLDQVPDSAVTVARMDETDFLTGTDSAQPAWVASLGAEIPEKEEAIDDSDWLFEEAPVDDTVLEETIVEETDDLEIDDELAQTLAASEAFTLPETAADEEEVFEEETQGAETLLFEELESEDEADEPLPEWMQEAGWQPRDPNAPEEPDAVADQADFEEAADGDEALSPAEIPEWLQAMAPKELSDDTQPNVVIPEEDAQAAPDIPEWLQDFEEGEDETILASLVDSTQEAGTSEDIPEWLLEPMDEADEAPEPALEAGEGGAIPDWLQDLDLETEPEEPESEEVSAEAFGALEETASFDAPQSPAETQEFATEATEATDTGEALPEWLQDLEPAVDEPALEQVDESAQEWLASLEQQETFEAEPVETTGGDELPDWLLDIAEDSEETPAEAEDRTGVSLWLRRNAPTGEDAGVEEEEAEGLPDVPVSEEEAGLQEEAADFEETEPVSAVGEGDTLQAERPDELQQALEEESTMISGSAETPSWLQGLDEELLSDAEETPEEAVEETEEPAVMETAEAGFEEMPDLEDSEATFRWLESLAARQGAREDELLTSPEERIEEPPDWIKNLAEEEAEEEEAAPEPAAAEAAPDDWLAEISVEDVPESQIQESPIEADTLDWGDIEEEVETTPEAAAEEVEEDLSWLEELSIEEGEEEFLVQPEETVEDAPAWTVGPAVDEEDIPEWLKEEISEPEPEAPGQELPEWLQEVDIEDEEEEEDAVPSWLEDTLVEEGGETEIAEPDQDEEAVYAWEQDETVFEAPETAEEADADAAAVEAGGEEEDLWWQRETGPLDASAVTGEAPDAAAGEAVEAPAAEEAPEPEFEEAPAAEETPEPEFEEAPAVEEASEPEFEEAVVVEETVEPEPEAEPEPEPVAAEIETEAPAEADMQEAEPEPQPEVPELVRAGEALQSGEIDRALGQYHRLIQKKSHLQEVISDLNEALQYNHPVNINIWTALGDAYAKAGQLQNALDAYTKAEELLR